MDRTNPTLVLRDQAECVSPSDWQSEVKGTMSFPFCSLVKGGVSPQPVAVTVSGGDDATYVHKAVSAQTQQRFKHTALVQ